MTRPRQLPTGGRRRFGLLRFSSVELLATLILLFIVTPFLEDLPHGDIVETILMTLVLVSGMLAVGGRRRTLAIAAALLIPALAGRWLGHIHPHAAAGRLFSVFGLAFIAFVVTQLLRYILRAPRVDAEVLCAAVSGYLMLGLLWTVAYAMVGMLSPDAFAFSSGPESCRVMNRFNAFYFSFVTLSTLGFGDVTPVSKVARMLTVLQAICGTFYVTMLIARLVAMYSPGKDRDPLPPDGES
jgi:hypothetical protein